MKNYVQEGEVITLIAPYARLAGEGAKVANIFGVAINDVAISVAGEFAVEGVFDIKALSTDVIAQGTKVYWDDTAKNITAVVGANLLVGAVTAAKANGELTARVYLDGAIR